MTNLLSNIGGMIQLVAAGWTMTVISGHTEMITLVQSANALPILLFSLFGGVLADNGDRRRVMIASQTFMMTVSVILAALTALGYLTPWVLLAFTFLIGCGTAMNNPSWHASVGDILDRHDVPSAVTLNSMAFNVTRSVGPAIGGVIVAMFGAAVAFATNAVSYCGIILAVARWNYRPPLRTLPREPLGAALATGFQYAAMSPSLLTVISRGFLFGATGIAIIALLPVVARDLLNGGPVVYGFLLGSFGLGAVFGAFVISWIRNRFRNETIARYSIGSLAAAALMLSLSTNPFLSCVVLMAAGTSWIASISLLNVTVQLLTPRWVVGRALSFYQMSTSGGMAIGAWLWGSFASSQGPASALMASSVAIALVAVMGFRFSLPEIGDLDLAPRDRFLEPDIELQLRPQSGPIKISIEYLIAQENLSAFLSAMAERRRARLRNGVRQWSLFRDLSEPQVWTETYLVATWADYIRYNQRRLRAEGKIAAALQEMHLGPDKPRVTRMIQRPADPSEIDIPGKDYSERT